MKKFVFLFTILLVIAAMSGCKSSSSSYFIEGIVDDSALEGATVYKIDRVYDVEGRTFGVDSTVIKDGKYSFKGKADTPDYCMISARTDDPDTYIYANVVVEKGANIMLHTLEDLSTKISGTPMNDVIQSGADKYSEAAAEIYKVYAQMNSPEMSAEEKLKLSWDLEDLQEKLYDMDYEFVKDNINNPGVWPKLHNAAVMSGTLEKQRDLIAGAEGKTLETEEYKEVADRVALLEKTAEGQKFTDFSLADPSGKMVSLSDYAGKGKYILVDFWASWCGPCKNEMPNVVSLYNKYKRKNFDIVSVSLDNRKENWISAIDDWGMPWNHMSDIKGWDCEAASLYGVTGIPHTVLISPDGTILSRGLYGEDLYNKVAECFK